MKRIIIATGTAIMLLTTAVVGLGQETSSSQEIDFGTFQPSEDGTFVEIKVSKGLINMAARITEESEPELAKVISGLRSIRINVLEFDEEKDAEVRARVQSIRSQLEDQEWEQVVKVQEKNEDVGIFVKMKEEESIEGLAVTVIDGSEAVLIHVDGRIRPEELAQVGERLNLPPLAEVGAMLK
jgi:hypothetical protein